MSKTFTIPYPPSVNNYWKRSKFGMYKSKEAREYTEKVEALLAGEVPLEGPVEAFVVVYRPRKVGDLDNTLKAILDSLKGRLYVDDKQIVKILAVRNDDKDNPRVEVTINAV